MSPVSLAVSGFFFYDRARLNRKLGLCVHEKVTGDGAGWNVNMYAC